MKRCLAFLPFFPAIGMLALSFFVAFVATKCDSKGLKCYAKIIVALLVIAALALIACGICRFFGLCGPSTFCPMPDKMQ